MPRTIPTFVNIICRTGQGHECPLAEFVRRVCEWVGSYMGIGQIVCELIQHVANIRVKVRDGIEWLVGIEPIRAYD